ncbi:ABC transporter [Acrocarpospora pleiomorpha]|uniref:ABC transporter n=1 Tax=Acrocarpospora pleiomorpha TaxID=90975 RepID=A0A5M3XTW7_9ACTN|nr:branched-chain amino acid ABC transporter permease/ATP-binding protein [Acrocarpospora pleiomorpha]GES24687.1 ABC transporter [Acrocarpospora pleiomorpha]
MLLQFIALGLSLGGAYALAGQGLSLIHRGSGVVNFAHGAMVGLGGYLSIEFRESGLPLALAAVLAVALTALVGAAVQHLVMRRLRDAVPLTRLIATLGVMTVLNQVMVLRYGQDPKSAPALLPTHIFRIGDNFQIGLDRVLLTIIAVLVTVVLWLVYKRTRFGLVTAAVSENPRCAATHGHSPQRVALINWAAGAGLAGLTGVLLAPLAFFTPQQVVFLVVPVLAVALIGNFSSFPLTLFGGLVVGVTESVSAYYIDAPGWSTSLPFLIIMIVLILRGKTLPPRGQQSERLPKVGSGRPPLPVLVFLIAAPALMLTLPANWADAVVTSALFGLVGLSVVVVTGYAGQLSLAQFALAGIGAFASARLAATSGASFVMSGIFAVVVAVLIGVVIALSAVRTRGVTLGIVTLGLALAIQRLVLENTDYTGGLLGTVVSPPSLLGVDFDAIVHPERYAALAVAALVLGGIVVSNLRRGPAGRRLLAVRTNERAAASLGINVAATKLYAFAVGAGLAGVAGAMLAFRDTHVNFVQFEAFMSAQVVVLVVLGGAGYISGGVAGSLIVAGGVFSQIGDTIGIAEYMTLAAGLMLLMQLTTVPDGMVAPLLGPLAHLRRRLPRFRQRRAPVAPPVAQDIVTGGGGGTLEVRNVSARFGGVLALDEVSLSVQPGEIVGLIGANGAGKTTLVDVVTGYVPRYEGSVLLSGNAVDGLSATRRARAGLGRSFQSLELFDDLTVHENLLMASDRARPSSHVLDLLRPAPSPLPPAAAYAVRELELEQWLDTPAASLPAGVRRLVAIGRAVAAEPAVLLLDEPAAGLDEHETAELGRLLRRIAAVSRPAMLLIEHDMSLVMSVCDRVVVLDAGRCIAEGTAREVQNDPIVRTAYFGELGSATTRPRVSERHTT